MMVSKSSQLRLFLFVILALSLYIQSTSAVVSCGPGQKFTGSRPYFHGGSGTVCNERVRAECTSRCRAMNRKVAKEDCTVEGLFRDWFRCTVCCGEPLNPPSPPPPRPSPRPPPSPSPPSPPPPSPPPPSPQPPPPSPPPPSPPPSPPPPSPPPPPPPSAPVGFCRAGQTSDMSPMTDCSLCTRGYCGNRCPGGTNSVKKVGGCNALSKACRCCCESSTLSLATE